MTRQTALGPGARRWWLTALSGARRWWLAALAGARRWWLAAVAAFCLLGGAIAYAVAGGGNAGASAPVGHVTSGSLAKFRVAVIARLRAEQLDYRWVVCVPSGRRFAGVRIVRCNVDFGEPHIVAYCSVFRDGRLLSSQDDPAIPCGHDDAGYSAPIVTYG